MPLDSACNDRIKQKLHERACEFAKAAECAGQAGKFWPMNDALFAIQETKNTADVDLVAIAGELGIDRSSFEACLAERGVPETVARDIAESKKRKINGTPAFFIRAQPYMGGLPEGVLDTIVEQERTRQSSRVP